MTSDSIVSVTKLRFADGQTCNVAGNSAADYVFDPVCVRFAVLSVIVYGLLMDREYLGISTAMEYFTLWIAILVAIMAWMAFAGGVLNAMYKKGWIASIYTPFISLPMVPINEFAAQGLSNWMVDGTWDTSGATVILILKHMAVVTCFDIMHGRYVAPVHPMVVAVSRGGTNRTGQVPPAAATAPAMPQETPHARQAAQIDAPPTQHREPSPPETPPAAEAQNAPLHAAAPPPAGTQGILAVKEHRFNAHDIIFMRSEDHYLNISTTTGDVLVRCKLSDAVDQLDAQLGMSINRSTWVAFKAIEETRNAKNGRLEITLSNGDLLVVPKLRKHSFDQSFRLFCQSTDTAA